MTLKLSDTQLWQHNLVSLIHSGMFLRAGTGVNRGLHTVVGIYRDGTTSAPMAKYADPRRAQDAADLVNRLAEAKAPIESN